MITNRYDSDMVLHYMINVSVMIATYESMLVYVTISKLNSWQYFLTSTYAYGKCILKKTINIYQLNVCIQKNYTHLNGIYYIEYFVSYTNRKADI